MKTLTRVAIGVAVVAIVAVASVGLPTGVDAHAALDRSAPAAGETLPEPPGEIRIAFTEPLETTYTGADLLDGSGARVAGTSVGISPENERELVITPPADLPDGNYTVAWRTLSAADGHTLQGYFGFRVGPGTVGSLAPPTAAVAAAESARQITRGLALIGLAALLAIAPLTLGVLDPARRTVPALSATIDLPLRRYTLFAAATAILGSLAALLAQAVAISPLGASVPVAVAETLGSTRYGELWLVRLLFLVAIAVSLAVAFWGRAAWRGAALGIGALLSLLAPIPFSLLSHAAALQEGRAAAIASDVLHLLAASVWAGGPFLFVLVLLPALRLIPADRRCAALGVAIPRFSIVGLAAWGVLALTGLYAAWLQVGTLGALTGTPYGQALLLKGALLVPILALAAFHLVLGRRGPTTPGAGRFFRTIAAEAAIAVAVLLVVGRLIGLEPAREVVATREPSRLAVPLSFATETGPRAAELAVSPGAAGVNTFTLDVAGAPLPEDAEGVLRFALPERDIGAQELPLSPVGPNRFAAEGGELALPGDWQVETIVRAIGDFAWSTDSVVSVSRTPPPSAEDNPAPRFAPAAILGLLAIAVGAAAMAAAIAGSGAVPRRRAMVATVGVVALAVGAAILAGARIAPPQPLLAATEPEASPAVPASPAEDEHEAMGHDEATPSADPTQRALPGPGTPVAGDGLEIAVAASPAAAGPVAVTIALRGDDDAPLTDARVVVLSEMPEMAMGRTETPAVESEPGVYVAKTVPLTMAGEWRLAVRVSPQGGSTQVFSFAVTVP